MILWLFQGKISLFNCLFDWLTVMRFDVVFVWKRKTMKNVIPAVFTALVLTTALFVYIIRHKRKVNAKKCFLELVSDVRANIAKAIELIAESPTEAADRERLQFIRYQFGLIDKLTAESEDVDWVNAYRILDEIFHPAGQLVMDMRKGIEFAKLAFSDGPRFMQEVGDLILTTERVLARGKQSQTARDLLAQAKAQHNKARQLRMDPNIACANLWIEPYRLLTSAKRDLERAKTAHVRFNSPESDSDAGPIFGGAGFG